MSQSLGTAKGRAWSRFHNALEAQLLYNKSDSSTRIALNKRYKLKQPPIPIRFLLSFKFTPKPKCLIGLQSPEGRPLLEQRFPFITEFNPRIH